MRKTSEQLHVTDEEIEALRVEVMVSFLSSEIIVHCGTW